MDIWDILFRAYNALASLYQHEKKNEKALEFLDKALNVAQRLSEKKQLSCDILLQKADVSIWISIYHYNIISGII